MIDRRSFLKRLGFLAAAAAIGPSVLRPVVVREGGIARRPGSQFVANVAPHPYRYLRLVHTYSSGTEAGNVLTHVELQGSHDMRTWRTAQILAPGEPLVFT